MPTRGEGAQLGDGVRRLVWVGGGCRAGGRAEARPPHAASLRSGTRAHVLPSRSRHTSPYRSLRAVHRLVLVLPEPLARAPHRRKSAIAPLVAASNHAFQCRAAHHDRRSLATCPVAPASLHVSVRPVGSTHLPPAHLVIRPRRIPFTPPAGGTLELPLIGTTRLAPSAAILSLLRLPPVVRAAAATTSTGASSSSLRRYASRALLSA